MKWVPINNSRWGKEDTIHVLNIEDNSNDAQRIYDMFQRVSGDSVEIVQAATISDAKHCFAIKPYDAVLLDLSLTDTSGVDEIKQVVGVMSDCPIIILARPHKDDAVLEAFNSYAQDYLFKWEFNEQLLCQSVYHAVEKHRIQKELERAKNEARNAIRTISKMLTDKLQQPQESMRAMLEMIDRLEKSSLTDFQAMYLRDLHQACQQLQSIITGVSECVKENNLTKNNGLVDPLQPTASSPMYEVVEQYQYDTQPSELLLQNYYAQEQIIVSVDKELFPLMTRYLNNRRKDVEQITLFAQKNRADFDKIWTLGHNMKGSAGSYRLPFIGEIGASLCKQAQARDSESILETVAILMHYLDHIHVVCEDDINGDFN